MIVRLILALIIFVGVALGMLLLADLLGVGLGGVPVAMVIAAWLKQWAWVVGFLAGAWYFFSGGLPAWPRRTPPSA